MPTRGISDKSGSQYRNFCRKRLLLSNDFFYLRFFRNDCALVAICANIISRCTIAAYIGVANLSNCAEFYGNLYADVLTYCKYACAVLNAVTNGFTRCNDCCTAALCNSCTCFCKWRYCDGYAHLRHLIGNGGTCLFILQICNHLKDSLKCYFELHSIT